MEMPSRATLQKARYKWLFSKTLEDFKHKQTKVSSKFPSVLPQKNQTICDDVHLTLLLVATDSPGQ